MRNRLLHVIAIAGLALGGTGGAIPGNTLDVPGSKQSAAMPEKARKSQRDIAQLVLGGATHSFPGMYTGSDWIRRRTRNFRRRGVGSRWQDTMRAGLR